MQKSILRSPLPFKIYVLTSTIFLLGAFSGQSKNLFTLYVTVNFMVKDDYIMGQPFVFHLPFDSLAVSLSVPLLYYFVVLITQDEIAFLDQHYVEIVISSKETWLTKNAAGCLIHGYLFLIQHTAKYLPNQGKVKQNIKGFNIGACWIQIWGIIIQTSCSSMEWLDSVTHRRIQCFPHRVSLQCYVMSFFLYCNRLKMLRSELLSKGDLMSVSTHR